MFRGSGPFNYMRIHVFRPKMNVSQVAQPSASISNAVALIEGQGYDPRKNPPRKQALPFTHLKNGKGIPKWMKDLTAKQHSGNGLFFPNIPVSSQDGSGYLGKSKGQKRNKLSLSSSEMIGNGLRFE